MRRPRPPQALAGRPGAGGRGPAAAAPEAGVRSPGLLPFFCSCSCPAPLWASAIHRRWAPGAPANDQELRAGVKEERGDAYEGDPRTPGWRTGRPRAHSAPGRKRAGAGDGRGASRSPCPPPPGPRAHLRPVSPGPDGARPARWAGGGKAARGARGGPGPMGRQAGRREWEETRRERRPWGREAGRRGRGHTRVRRPLLTHPPERGGGRAPRVPRAPGTAQAPDRALAGTPSARAPPRPGLEVQGAAPRRMAGAGCPPPNPLAGGAAPPSPRTLGPEVRRGGAERPPRASPGPSYVAWAEAAGSWSGGGPSAGAAAVAAGGRAPGRAGGATAGKVLLLGKSGDSSSASSGLARQGRAPRAGGEWAPTGDRRTGSSCFCGGLGAPSRRSSARGGPAASAGSGVPAAPAPSSRGRAAAADREAGGGGGRPAAAGIGGRRGRGGSQAGRAEKEGAES